MGPGWKALLRDPLLHFALLGTALFLLLPGEEDSSSSRIEVSRADLVGFLQEKARLFDGRTFDQVYDGLSPQERRELLDDYVRQEALYRRALADGLDKADPLVRGRMVQQMELLLREDSQAEAVPTRAEVEAYFDRHRADYADPGSVTFTHVFFDRSRADAPAAARAALADLRNGRVAPEDALPFGDRFAYQRNYAGASKALLEPEVGPAVARAAFEVPVGQWAGPFQSPLGWHLLLVTRRQAPSTPPLDAIYADVARDAQAARRTRRGEEAIRQLLAEYRVVRAGDLGPLE